MNGERNQGLEVGRRPTVGSKIQCSVVFLVIRESGSSVSDKLELTLSQLATRCRQRANTRLTSRETVDGEGM